MRRDESIHGTFEFSNNKGVIRYVLHFYQIQCKEIYPD